MENTTAATWNEPTADKIAEWKKQYMIDHIHVLKAKDSRDGSIKKAYCRAPQMNDLIRAAASQKEKAGTYNQSLFENCVLDMHPDVKSRNDLYQGMVFNMDKIIIAAEVEVEKL